MGKSAGWANQISLLLGGETLARVWIGDKTMFGVNFVASMTMIDGDGVLVPALRASSGSITGSALSAVSWPRSNGIRLLRPR